MAEYDGKNDCFVTVCPLPGHVKGLVKEVVDARVILINQDLSDEEKERTLRHELRHLQRDDMRRQQTIAEIEREADQ